MTARGSSPPLASTKRAIAERMAAGTVTDDSQSRPASARARRAGVASGVGGADPWARRAAISVAKAVSRGPPIGARPASAASAGKAKVGVASA